jgi:hypothetical protein
MKVRKMRAYVIEGQQRKKDMTGNVTHTVNRTSFLMRMIGFPAWKHETVRTFGGVAGMFEDRIVEYRGSADYSKPNQEKKNTEAETEKPVFTPHRHTRSIDEWLAL